MTKIDAITDALRTAGYDFTVRETNTRFTITILVDGKEMFLNEVDPNGTFIHSHIGDRMKREVSDVVDQFSNYRDGQIEKVQVQLWNRYSRDGSKLLVLVTKPLKDQKPSRNVNKDPILDFTGAELEDGDLVIYSAEHSILQLGTVSFNPTRKKLIVTPKKRTGAVSYDTPKSWKAESSNRLIKVTGDIELRLATKRWSQ